VVKRHLGLIVFRTWAAEFGGFGQTGAPFRIQLNEDLVNVTEQQKDLLRVAKYESSSADELQPTAAEGGLERAPGSVSWNPKNASIKYEYDCPLLAQGNCPELR
jgi:hypothetical protein